MDCRRDPIREGGSLESSMEGVFSPLSRPGGKACRGDDEIVEERDKTVIPGLGLSSFSLSLLIELELFILVAARTVGLGVANIVCGFVFTVVVVDEVVDPGGVEGFVRDESDRTFAFLFVAGGRAARLAIDKGAAAGLVAHDAPFGNAEESSSEGLEIAFGNPFEELFVRTIPGATGAEVELERDDV